MSVCCRVARAGLAIALSLGGAVAPANAQSAANTSPAQGWPTRHVSMVVPFAAGSSSDAVGRIVAAGVSERLGQQVIVENVGGAGGMVGSARVARAEPDGYQFVLGSTDTLAQNQTIYKNPQYNAATDYAPVALVGEMALLLVARKELPVANLKELATYAKVNFGKMQFGSSGLGSSSHLTCSQLTQAIGANVAHVPYRGSGPALQDMIAGQIDYFCSLAAAAAPLIENNQLKVLAVLTRERSPFLPQMETAQEQGFANIDAPAWMAAAYPKGTRREIVDKLAKAISDTLDTPATQQRLRSLAVVPASPERRTPAYLQTFIESEIEKWAVVIKASGVKLD